MLHFEKVTQSKTDYPADITIMCQNSVNMKEKAVIGQVRSRYQKAEGKEKALILNELLFRPPDTTGSTPCVFLTGGKQRR
jgi:hypothetical protein